MGNRNSQIASDALRILHGARGLQPDEAVEKLEPFLEGLRSGQGDKLADASIAAVTKLARSLRKITWRPTIFGKRLSRPRSAM
jgi:hypothetical protein